MYTTSRLVNLWSRKRLSLLNSSHTAGLSSNAIAFSYKLPNEGYALRAVAIVDSVPELRFDASPKVPTITEEDFAAAARLATENRRPEFCYVAIPPIHPFYGRQYQHYSPQWLRETSLGNLFSEADWNMKCLSIGARSDESKTKFWAWNKTSQLEGLGTSFDFPCERPEGSIYLSCKSVKVQKSENELVFVEEPKMGIVNNTSSAYSDYITEAYNSVAYHDEPIFLKMREVPKLILAAEWLKEKGVNFSHEWMMESTKPRESHAIEVKQPETTKYFFKQVQRELYGLIQKSAVSIPGTSVEVTIQKKHVTDKGLELEIAQKTHSFLGIHLPVQPSVVHVVKATMNDYDNVYSGMNPNQPLSLISGSVDPTQNLVIPNVKSWSELYSETVPRPCVFQVPCESVGVQAATGGVSTTNIPVLTVAASASVSAVGAGIAALSSKALLKETAETTATSNAQTFTPKAQVGPYKQCGEQIAVRAQQSVRKESTTPPEHMLPKPEGFKEPSKDVRFPSMSKKGPIGSAMLFGYSDGPAGEMAMFDPDGTPCVQRKSLRVVDELTINGERVGMRHHRIDFPTTKQSNDGQQSAAAQKQNLPPLALPEKTTQADNPSHTTVDLPIGATDEGDDNCSTGSNDSGISSPLNNPEQTIRPPGMDENEQLKQENHREMGPTAQTLIFDHPAEVTDDSDTISDDSGITIPLNEPANFDSGSGETTPDEIDP